MVLCALGLVVPWLWRAVSKDVSLEAKRFVLRTSDGRNVKPRSPVRMRGLEVGSVDSIEMDTDGVLDIHFHVESAYAGVVRFDAHAALVEPLALGLTHVELDPGNPDTEESAGGRIAHFEPKTLENKLEWSIAKSEEFAAKLEPLIAKADQAAAATGKIQRSLTDRDGFLGALTSDEKPLKDLDRLLAGVASIQGDLAEVRGAIDRREGTLGRALAPDDPLRASIERLSARVDETVASMEGVRRRLEGAASLVTARIDAAIASVAGVSGIMAEATAIGASFGEAYAKTQRRVGSIGRYLNDPSLVSDLRRWLTELTESSDTSDPGPVNYVTGLGFRASPKHPDNQVGPGKD